MDQQSRHPTGSMVPRGGCLILVVLTACTFQNYVLDDSLIECDTNEDCPSGYGCEVDTELCVSDADLEPPANDSCAAKETLILSESPEPIFGRTRGATHSMSGPITELDGERSSCNGDAEVPAESTLGPAADVFYYLHVESTTNLDIFVDGSASTFSSALYVMELPGPSCPADLRSLEPFLVNESPLCEYGIELRARMPMAPAGHYLVVVDGQHIDDAFYGVLYNTEGFFEIWAKRYPGDFPPPTACIEAPEVAVPIVGQPTTFEVDFEDAPNELRAACGGRGAERAFTLRPQSDVDVLIVTGGRDGNADTVAYLLNDGCSNELALAATSENGQCNDDGKNIPNYGSLLNVSLVAGREYFLVVDTYSAEMGSAEVFISVDERSSTDAAPPGR